MSVRPNRGALIEGPEFEELTASIRTSGLRDAVVLYEGMILDGRNRYRACLATQVEPRFEAFEGADPAAFFVDRNLRRRHLNESQRAMIAAKLASLGPGRPDKSGQLAGSPQEKAADMLNVGERSVRRAVEVRYRGAPELVQAVERGAVSLSAAADVASKPVDEQKEIVARGEREIAAAYKKIRAEKSEVTRQKRVEKLRELSAVDRPFPERRYSLIYADPPWRHWEGTSTESRRVENHYPTMELDEICRLPIGDLATKDAVLIMWSTSPHLAEALQVLQAWGFEYRTTTVWVKDKIGTGYFVRNQYEILLIAVRGSIPHPATRARPSSVISACRREHSRKPGEAYVVIESMYPELPKIELFARKGRPGWDAWGNEIESPSIVPDIPDEGAAGSSEESDD